MYTIVSNKLFLHIYAFCFRCLESRHTYIPTNEQNIKFNVCQNTWTHLIYKSVMAKPVHGQNSCSFIYSES